MRGLHVLRGSVDRFLQSMRADPLVSESPGGRNDGLSVVLCGKLGKLNHPRPSLNSLVCLSAGACVCAAIYDRTSVCSFTSFGGCLFGMVPLLLCHSVQATRNS